MKTVSTETLFFLANICAIAARYAGGWNKAPIHSIRPGKTPAFDFHSSTYAARAAVPSTHARNDACAPGARHSCGRRFVFSAYARSSSEGVIAAWPSSAASKSASCACARRKRRWKRACSCAITARCGDCDAMEDGTADGEGCGIRCWMSRAIACVAFRNRWAVNKIAGKKRR